MLKKQVFPMLKQIFLLTCFMIVTLVCCAEPLELLPRVTIFATYNNISASQARTILYSGADYLFLDVREVSEFNAGHILGAVNMP